MTIIDENALNRILNHAWTAYQQSQNAIDTLEAIGLNVDGNSAKAGTMSVLFGVMTAAENVMLSALGIPDASAYGDEGLAVLSSASSEERSSENMPDRIKYALMAVAQKCFEKDMPEAQDGDTPHEVTLAMTGSITVMAASVEKAMNIASDMPSGTLIAAACWEDCGPSATDAYENG